ncbi:hypothetical protein [Chitinophaga tropicalis]|uniref:Uncharacterized protein n=1 Tax=Chitinophaga tropicalis TaxID=2683588 RepID=A0A7K1UBJ0_9BACT|nr:hypothetical protein [Chitinophaga tropicalis]MVT11345.1 hypothetical protein [Chitinophaga tropicalis]
MEKKVDRQTMINTLDGMIDNSYSISQLNACSVIVHDVMWTRYNEDQEEKRMQSAIQAKRDLINLNKKGC